MSDKKRVNEIKRILKKNGRYFGKRILDIACGGGILGFLIKDDRYYVGIDINPDMMRYANNYRKKTKSRSNYILGDVTKKKINGRFDTFTFLGNGLAHFTTNDFVSVLTNLKSNMKKKSYFIIEYRDVIDLLFNRQWKDKMIERDSGKTIISTTVGSNMKTGEIYKTAVDSKNREKVKFSHAIWSPFILEPIMKSFSWKLISRKEMKRWHGWIEIYQK